MKTLSEMAEEVLLEQLQLEWDTFLVKAWYEYSKASMRRTVGAFFRIHMKGMTEEKAIEMFSKLKRVPWVYHHWKTCVSRFIAGYIPVLNAVLWNDKLPRNEIVRLLNASNYDATRDPDNREQHRKEKAEQDSATKAEEIYTSLRRIRADARYASSRSNWKACK